MRNQKEGSRYENKVFGLRPQEREGTFVPDRVLGIETKLHCKSMTPEKAAAIIKRRLHGRLVKRAYTNYTGNGSKTMNIAVGARPELKYYLNNPKNRSATMRTTKGYFESMRRHAKKFPRTVPTLYRGMRANNPKAVAMLANFAQRKSYHYPSFLSFSTNRNVAIDFKLNRVNNIRKGFIITINRGTYPAIRHNTYTPSQSKNEKEVTLAPGKYTMIRKTNNGFNVKYTPNK